MTETRSCQNCKLDFQIEPEDFEFYERMNVPPPTWCPDCRLQRRAVFYAERTLYKRICGLCKKNIVSMYHADVPFPVYCMKCWWSDAWDGLEYGQVYDSGKPFLEQLKELELKTPHVSLSLDYTTMVNTEYANYAGHLKSCYMVFMGDYSENVVYSQMFHHAKDCADSFMFSHTELCYELVDSGPCYRAYFSEDCESCHDIAFCKSCVGCSNCFGCTNLRNKQYYFFNEPCTKEDYEKKVKGYDLSSASNIEKAMTEAEAWWLRFPVKYAHRQRNVNSTGEYVFDSKNTHDSYVVLSTEDGRYCQEIAMGPVKDAYDYTQWGNNAELLIECLSVGEGASRVRYCIQCWPNVRELDYCIWTLSSHHCFGCVNLRKKEYCILNKQYSSEEFERVKKKVIADMNSNPYRDALGRSYPYGEFIPSEFSSFAYNETLANRYKPLEEHVALAHGFTWRSDDPTTYKATLKSDALPDYIEDATEAIINEIIECKNCRTAYRIVPSEFRLLKLFNIALPRVCYNCRHLRRLKRICGNKLYERSCLCTNETHHNHTSRPCSASFETPYAPNRPEIVYCEDCYQQEVV